MRSRNSSPVAFRSLSRFSPPSQYVNLRLRSNPSSNTRKGARTAGRALKPNNKSANLPAQLGEGSVGRGGLSASSLLGRGELGVTRSDVGSALSELVRMQLATRAKLL